MMSYYSFAVLLLVIVSVADFAMMPLTFPGYGYMLPRENCKSSCSPKYNTCPRGSLCCNKPIDPCGFHCTEAKINVPKLGSCPPPSTKLSNPQWSICDGHFCDVDNDCNGGEKCCPNKCGASVCVPSILY